ncbi:putative integral membrane protein [Theileria parva strain Muguga]|uniref:Vitellogenin domain-containing protein n=1 Tax=Theileria parva TaxID=5875 RepID=Q4N0X8_THEPA|nr:putative integral membrane protein [Theileria parva strain Muguga]EAN30903.1 putative integral membrane protein [Theileria parva strain Muguga]|eukprot:XP_763186.1 hypothetical protein [Theileria parva strain Muguga]
MFSKILVFALLNVFSALCNFSLVPSQVLLPRTSVYTSKRTHQPITVNTQIPLKIEPTLCVIWKIQDPQLLAFDKSNYTHPKSKVPGDSQDFEPYTPHELKNCLPSVVINTVPLNFKTDTLYNLEKNIKNIKNEKNEKKINTGSKSGLENVQTISDLRTFVFAYDSKFRFHGVTEVVISKLDHLTLETAYRKISKNQTFTLKLRGFDKVGNTFTSLEGLPFYLSFSGSRIFDVLDNEGELYSEKRASVLSQAEHFDLPENTTLVTDVLMLKGAKVGKTTLTFGLFLDEYSDVATPPVEFVVNDSVVLSHQQLYLLDNTSFQLTLKYPSSEYVYQYPNGNGDINLSNYEWSTDADADKLTLDKGLVQVHLHSESKETPPSDKPSTNEYKCVVYCKDKRTDQVLKTYVNVMKPHSVVIKHNSLGNFHTCLMNKDLLALKDFKMTKLADTQYEDYLNILSQSGGELSDCYNQKQEERGDVINLFEGNHYLFKLNLLTYNKNVFDSIDANAVSFNSTSADEDGLLTLMKQKDNYYVFKASNLGCQYYNVSYDLSRSENPEKLSNKYQICVLEQVKLQGFSTTKAKLKDGYPCAERPLVVLVGDEFELNPKGGSGRYRYELDNCHVENNKCVCNKKGSYQLKIVDSNNEENGLLVQVISTTIKSSKFLHVSGNTTVPELHNQVNVRLNQSFSLRLSLFGDLQGFKPMFKEKFEPEDSILYSFNYLTKPSYLIPFNEREKEMFGEDFSENMPRMLNYDKNVLEFKGVEKDPGGFLLLNFHTLACNTTKLYLNLELIKSLTDTPKRLDILQDQAGAKFAELVVNVYRDPVLYVSEKHQLPVLNLTTVTPHSEVLANIPLGGMLELNYKYGVPNVKPKLLSTGGGGANSVLHIEPLTPSDKDSGNGFMVYCLNLGSEDVSFEFLDYKKEYRIKCSMPKYNRIYPLNKLTSDLYELVQTSYEEDQNPSEKDQEVERRYTVNKNKVNRYVNLLFDSDNNLLLPSKLYRPHFNLYTQNDEELSSSQFEEISGSQLEEVGKDGEMMVFKLNDSFKGSGMKVVGVYRYENYPENYSETFNRLHKYKRFNQQLLNALKNSQWDRKNKTYIFQDTLHLNTVSNPSVVLVDSDSPEVYQKDLDVMYNRKFEYRLYVHGGSGKYSLTTHTPNVKYSFSKLYAFDTEDSKRSFYHEDSIPDESLPVSVKDTHLVVNLFDNDKLRGSGRFLTFSSDESGDVILGIKDDDLLWQDTLKLNVHLRRPNNLKMYIHPISPAGSDRKNPKVQLMKEGEQLVFLDEKYKLGLECYHNTRKLLAKTTMLSFQLLDDNILMKIQSKGGHRSKVDKEELRSELMVRGEEEVEMKTVELGTSTLLVRDLEGTMKVPFKFKVSNKPLLSFEQLTVLPGTKFDVSFENIISYSNLVVKTTCTSGHCQGQEPDKENPYSLKFENLGTYNHDVEVMYSDNELTRLSHKLTTNVSRPVSMELNLPSLSESVNSGTEENKSEYLVERNSVHNLNVLVFDDKNNLFTPLYLNSPSLKFDYKFTNTCKLLNDPMNSTQLEEESNRNNVQLLVTEECELEVLLKYNNSVVQSKKVEFKIKPVETLFGDTETDEVEESDYRCGSMDMEESLSYGGVYEISKSFKSYPENKLKHLGNNLYKVTSEGSVMLTTDSNVYNLKLLRPTHFSLSPVRSEFSSETSESRSSRDTLEHDIMSSNTSKLSFNLNLYSNRSRLRMPLNSKFTLRFKDLSVFTYTLEKQLLTLTPSKIGETTMEILFNLGSGVTGGVSAGSSRSSGRVSGETRRSTGLEERLNRIYHLKNTVTDYSSELTAIQGAGVYLAGRAINTVVANIDVNTHEFSKLLKNKFTVKTFRPSFGTESEMTHINLTEILNTETKLKSKLSSNRGTYKVFLNMVTDSLNMLFTTSRLGTNNSSSRDSGRLFSVNALKDAYHCTGCQCRLQLKYKLESPVTLNDLQAANALMYEYYTRRRRDENMEDLMRMLSSPLYGLDDSMWNKELGAVRDSSVKVSLPGKQTFKNSTNDQFAVSTVPFNPSNFKFKQVNGSTILLLPNSAKGFKEDVVLGNTMNVEYYNYELKYKFSDQILDKLFYLKPSYRPYTGSEANETGDTSLIHRLGYDMVLINTYNRDWNILKNYLRTMSNDLLKGKHKVTLTLLNVLTTDGGKDSVKLLEQELEVHLPEIMLFVDGNGHILNEINESNFNNLIHAYPLNTSYKLHLTSDRFLLKTIEKSGQLTTFIVYCNASPELIQRAKEETGDEQLGDYLMVLDANDNIVAKIKINTDLSSIPTGGLKLSQLNILNRAKFSDLLHISVVVAILLFILFVHNTIKNSQFREPMVPIKLDRTLPKSFQHLYQTNYNYRSYG